MSEEKVMTKAELLAHNEQNWNALNTALDQLSTEQLTEARDAEGWNVKDHLAHILAWERSVVFLLQGQDRHAGLGVDKALYQADDVDAINAAIQRQHAGRSLAEVRDEMWTVHAQLLTLLEPLTDEDLQRPYAHYLPDESGEGAGPPAMDVVYSNSADHFAEHIPWIEAIARGDC